eukprot:scaffold111094_cov51-Attheya_sp.AAC.1
MTAGVVNHEGDSSSSPENDVSGSCGEFFVPPSDLRGVFCGSGADAVSDPRIAEAVLDLVDTTTISGTTTSASSSDAGSQKDDRHEEEEEEEPVRVLYLGTAQYDLPDSQEQQTRPFLDLNCTVSNLCVASADPPPFDELQSAVQDAHVIVVSGGNTLHALDCWRAIGLDQLLCDAAERGAVITGGSAGAVCWFDAGHSDSMDPNSYRDVVLGNAKPTATTDDWDYIRVPGLAILPGLLCPHHDRVQSNGVLRGDDFDDMLRKRHSNEMGIGIDHWAAFIVEPEGRYRVLSLKDKPGSVLWDDKGNPRMCRNQTGIPGVWIKTVEPGGSAVTTTLCPWEGLIQDLLRESSGTIVEDERVEICRNENPSPIE